SVIFVYLITASFQTFLTLATRGTAHRERQQHYTPWSKGDMVPIECPVLTENGTQTEQWGPGPLCLNAGEELSFPFATDAEYRCRLSLDPTHYNFVRHVLENNAAWHCRIPLSKDKSFYTPLTITLWGETEPTHFHIFNHINFVFHVIDGFFLGAAAYGLRDHYTPGLEGSTLDVHGPVRWFVGHTFDLHPGDENQPQKPASGPSIAKPVPLGKIPRASELMNAVRPAIVIMWVGITATVTAGVCALIYEGYLKPTLVKEARKQK
ncbi:hypothetical protein HK104_005009, partial [Borealophlyctis nickersoniae]